MLQLGGELDFAVEPIRAERGGELGVQDLDGHFAIVLEIRGQVDGGHATAAQLALDAVTILEGGLQTGEDVGHGLVAEG